MTAIDRTEKLLHGLRIDLPGVEIGPSFAPIAPKAKGFQTTVVDHASKDELVSKYQGHAVDVGRIEDVDVVWTSGSLAEALHKRCGFAWVIASHVIEHTPDLIGFVNGCEQVLDDEGTLSLAVPDRRYCFDFWRRATGIGAVIDAHLIGRQMHSPGTVAEHHLYAVLSEGAVAWSRGTRGTLSPAHSIAFAKEIMTHAISASAYIDCHAWVFTPSSFRLLVHDLAALGMIRLRESTFFDSEGCEFIVQLSRNGHGPSLSREELLERSRAESAGG